MWRVLGRRRAPDKNFFPIDISTDIFAAFFCGFFGKLTKPAPHLRLRILRVFAAPPLRPLPDAPQWRNNRFGTSGFRPRLPESCAGAKTLGGSQGNAGEFAFSNSNGVARRIKFFSDRYFRRYFRRIFLRFFRQANKACATPAPPHSAGVCRAASKAFARCPAMAEQSVRNKRLSPAPARVLRGRQNTWRLAGERWRIRLLKFKRRRAECGASRRMPARAFPARRRLTR